MDEKREWKNGKPGKQEGQKLKSLLVIQYILKHADEDHPVTIADIQNHLGKYGKFIDLPIKIQTFHRKNTPVHWGKNYPIKQECSLA